MGFKNVWCGGVKNVWHGLLVTRERRFSNVWYGGVKNVWHGLLVTRERNLSSALGRCCEDFSRQELKAGF